MRHARTCLDCPEKIPPSEPSYKTRCRRCYSLHRNSLKIWPCKICGQRSRREEWKKTCAGCYKAQKIKEKEDAAGPVIKVKREDSNQKIIEECGLNEIDFDEWE